MKKAERQHTNIAIMRNEKNIVEKVLDEKNTNYTPSKKLERANEVLRKLSPEALEMLRNS